MTATTETVTNDLTNGGLYLSSNETDLDAMIGVATNSGTGETFNEIRNQWYGDATERSWPRRVA